MDVFFNDEQEEEDNIIILGVIREEHPRNEDFFENTVPMYPLSGNNWSIYYFIY